jgi:ElaA protein
VERDLAGLTVRSAAFADLRPHELYGILRLRSEVFVVEQDAVYLDADGRDAEPSTVHWWVEDAVDGGAPVVVACARLLLSRGSPGSSIGRVVTHAAHRRRGLAGRVVDEALRVAPRPVTIHAQAHLEGWYARRFGFVREGGEFLEDGIPHVSMVLA